MKQKIDVITKNVRKFAKFNFLSKTNAYFGNKTIIINAN